jgi:hypothetical protein
MADRRTTIAERTWYKIGFCSCLTVNILFPIMLVLLWRVGFHWTVICVIVLEACFPVCLYWLASV